MGYNIKSYTMKRKEENKIRYNARAKYNAQITVQNNGKYFGLA